MPFAGAGPSVGVEPAAKRRRKGQLMPKVKELDETHGISLTELISVFHVLHRDVDGRVPLREIASLVAGRRLASGLHARANLQAALGEKWGGGKAAAEAACCDCGGCLPVSAASSERSLSPAPTARPCRCWRGAAASAPTRTTAAAAAATAPRRCDLRSSRTRIATAASSAAGTPRGAAASAAAAATWSIVRGTKGSI